MVGCGDWQRKRLLIVSEKSKKWKTLVLLTNLALLQETEKKRIVATVGLVLATPHRAPSL